MCRDLTSFIHRETPTLHRNMDSFLPGWPGYTLTPRVRIVSNRVKSPEPSHPANGRAARPAPDLSLHRRPAAPPCPRSRAPSALGDHGGRCTAPIRTGTGGALRRRRGPLWCSAACVRKCCAAHDHRHVVLWQLVSFHSSCSKSVRRHAEQQQAVLALRKPCSVPPSIALYSDTDTVWWQVAKKTCLDACLQLKPRELELWSACEACIALHGRICASSVAMLVSQFEEQGCEDVHCTGVDVMSKTTSRASSAHTSGETGSCDAQVGKPCVIFCPEVDCGLIAGHEAGALLAARSQMPSLREEMLGLAWAEQEVVRNSTPLVSGDNCLLSGLHGYEHGSRGGSSRCSPASFDTLERDIDQRSLLFRTLPELGDTPWDGPDTMSTTGFSPISAGGSALAPSPDRSMCESPGTAIMKLLAARSLNEPPRCTLAQSEDFCHWRPAQPSHQFWHDELARLSRPSPHQFWHDEFASLSSPSTTSSSISPLSALEMRAVWPQTAST